MSDYSKGKIYKIVCHETEEVYYGSTVQTLSKRLSQHREYNKSCSSRQIIDRGNYSIELVKDFPCNSKKELLREEGIFIRNNECINRCIAGRTKQEYFNDNKDRRTVYFKEYRLKNIDRIKEYDKFRCVRDAEIKNQRSKESYIRRSEHLHEKVTCDCGAVVSRNCLARHKKRQIHKDLLQNIN